MRGMTRFGRRRASRVTTGVSAWRTSAGPCRSNHGALSTIPRASTRRVVRPQRHGQAAGRVAAEHDVRVAARRSAPTRRPARGSSRAGRRCSSGSGGAAASGRTCAGRGRRSRSPARSTTRRTPSGRSSRRSRGRAAPPRVVRRPAGRRTRVATTGPSSSSGSSIVSAVYGDPRTSGTASAHAAHSVSGPQPSAAATSPAKRLASSRTSGCHWTARQKRGPGRSIASSEPSAAQAVASKPGCVATDWWWWQPTSTRSPTRVAEPGPVGGRHLGRAEGVARRGCAPRARPGRACAGPASRRPRTAISCIPRQTPSVGQTRRVGRPQQRRLPGVAVLAPGRGARVRLLAVARRVDVRAAADDQPVDAAHDHGGDVVRTPTPAAAAPVRRPRPAPRRRTARAARRRACPTPPTAPARGRW